MRTDLALVELGHSGYSWNEKHRPNQPEQRRRGAADRLRQQELDQLDSRLELDFRSLMRGGRIPARFRQDWQDVIPRPAMTRTHLARGAVRAGFLLRGRPKKVFEVSPAGRFPLLGPFEKAKICLCQSSVGR